MNTLFKAAEKLKSIHQHHVLKHFEELSPIQKEILLSQIEALDASLLLRMQEELQIEKKESTCFQPIDNYTIKGSKEDTVSGKALLAEGKCACVILAGGEGSRLGYHQPKGCFPITVVKYKSLFQLISEKVKACSHASGTSLQIAIMTAPSNHLETLHFFETHCYFGLEKEQIHFFSQSEWPLLNSEGNVFFETPHKIACGSNGNGGMFSQLSKSGILKKWIDRGIKILSVIPIDNPLGDPFDAEGIGFHHRMKAEVSLKAAWRKTPDEKMGIVTSQGGNISVIEYHEYVQDIDVPTLGNLGLYTLDIDFVMKYAERALPLHKAKKRVKMKDSSGNICFSEGAVAWKFEQYIFDFFAPSKSTHVIVYPREECFAPLKNFEGEDSITSVQSALLSADRNQFYKISGKLDLHKVFELAPEFYYPTDQLLSKWLGKALPEENYIKA